MSPDLHTPMIDKIDELTRTDFQNSDPEALRKKLDLVPPWQAGELHEEAPCFGCQKMIRRGEKVWMAGDRMFCDTCSQDSDLGWRLYDHAQQELDAYKQSMKVIEDEAATRRRRAS